MTRDWELVREILVKLEEKGDTRRDLRPEEIQGHSREVVSYHIKLLIQAGLVEGTYDKTLSGPLYCFARDLTWEGHEFLDKIRNDTVWNKVKTTLKNKGVEFSFDSSKKVASEYIRSMIS